MDIASKSSTTRWVRILLLPLIVLGLASATAASAAAAPPSNDDVASPMEITALPFQHTQDLSEATSVEGEPDCAGNSVWFRFSPTATAEYRMWTAAPDVNENLNLLEGAPGNFQQIGPCHGNGAVLSYPLEAGKAYYLSVGVSAGTAGPVTLHLEVVPPPPPEVYGMYYPLQQTRILDTRAGLGAPQAPLAAGQTATVQVGGRGGVATSGVSAVVLNLTGVTPTARGWLTAYASDSTRPGTTSLSLTPSVTRANHVTVPVGADGGVKLYNAAGSVHVVADVLGFYNSDATVPSARGNGSLFHLPNAPTRILDTRRLAFGAKPTSAYSNRVIGADFGPAANTQVRALVLNVTAVSPSRGGWITAWNGAGQAPPVSTLSFRAGHIVPNLAIVPTRLDVTAKVPTVTLRNQSSGTTHLVVDLVGYYADGGDGGLRFSSLNPVRTLDTRRGFVDRPPPLGPNQARTYNAGGGYYPDRAMVANITAISPTADTYLTVWGPPSPQVPHISQLNPERGVTTGSAVVAGLFNGCDLFPPCWSTFSVYNNRGTTHFTVDLQGHFTQPAVPAGLQPGGPATPQPRVWVAPN